MIREITFSPAFDKRHTVYTTDAGAGYDVEAADLMSAHWLKRRIAYGVK